MPKWFEEYLKSLPDYRVDELIEWLGDGPDLYERAEAMATLLYKVNS